MLIGAAVVLTGCNSDVEKTSMSMNGECVLMATATEADINPENYLTPVLQLAWQSPQWYSNDDTRKSTFNNLPAYIQTATEPGFNNVIESAANGQSMTYTAGNLNSFAKKLGMEIVAEGIETREQVDFLAKQDCDLIQGFYFSKPIPKDDFMKLISETAYTG